MWGAKLEEPNVQKLKPKFVTNIEIIKLGKAIRCLTRLAICIVKLIKWSIWFELFKWMNTIKLKFIR